MIENCTIYLPVEDVDLNSLLPGGAQSAGSLGAPNTYDYDTPQGTVKLTVNYAADDPSHLEGLLGYILQLENSPEEVSRATSLVEKTNIFLGVILPEPVAKDSEAFQSLLFIAEQLDGFMFILDSILTREGFLVGPATYGAERSEPPQSSQQHDPADVAPEMVAIRGQNMALLAKRGFVCAESLPIMRSQNFGTLRPTIEMAQRLLAQFALFMWVAAPPEKASTSGIDYFLVNNNLAGACTERELEILQMTRDDANAEFGGTIGWSLENIWVLSWIFGFEPEPAFQSGQIPVDTTNSLLAFLPNLGTTVDEFLQTNPSRSEQEVVKKEDLFYCAHNAVRSAQMGHPAVPEGFHPLRDGGAVHERRHALTWSLSPGTGWEQTDLST